tara:strand:+ start:87 stop:461 length:375 start_codon:yes stop_codon:yes gene_type:complete
MAQFTRANGDFYPVLRLDATGYSNPGVNAIESAMTVQPQGPKLDYFTVTAAGALTTTDIKNAFDTIQGKGIVYIYEYTDTGSDTLAFAIYPTAAWTTATLDTDLNTAGGGLAACVTTATATFTN